MFHDAEEAGRDPIPTRSTFSKILAIFSHTIKIRIAKLDSCGQLQQCARMRHDVRSVTSKSFSLHGAATCSRTRNAELFTRCRRRHRSTVFVTELVSAVAARPRPLATTIGCGRSNARRGVLDDHSWDPCLPNISRRPCYIRRPCSRRGRDRWFALHTEPEPNITTR